MYRTCQQCLGVTLLLLLFALAACGPAAAPASPAAPELPTAIIVPTVPQAYPAPVAAATPTLAAAYPEPPTMMPTVDPYPGGLVWVLRPVGIQCEEGTAPGYANLREATATMTSAGIRVNEAQMTELMVPAVCGSPTSAHFRLQIDATDLQTAVSLGWTEEL
jgi:hypothetical protein